MANWLPNVWVWWWKLEHTVSPSHLSNHDHAHLQSTRRSAHEQNRWLLRELRMSWVMGHHLYITSLIVSVLKTACRVMFCISYKNYWYHISIDNQTSSCPSGLFIMTSTVMKRRQVADLKRIWLSCVVLFFPCRMRSKSVCHDHCGLPSGFHTRDGFNIRSLLSYIHLQWVNININLKTITIL